MRPAGRKVKSDGEVIVKVSDFDRKDGQAARQTEGRAGREFIMKTAVEGCRTKRRSRWKQQLP